MKKTNWLKGAVLLGLVFFLAVFLIKPIGVSTQFSVASGIIHSIIDRDVIQNSDKNSSGYSSTNAYYNKSGGSLAKSIKNPLNYDFIFVLAIPFGALAGYLLDKRRRFSNVSKSEKLQSEGPESETSCLFTRNNFLRSYMPAFLGGFLLLFGARMADGCTSGHMMSGMMQGSVSGYIFAGSVFASAIPAAMIVKKIKMRKAGCE
jgi:uncharacterized protein